jgi:hypothetical protein
MGIFRRTPELFSEQRTQLGTPRAIRRWGILWRTVLRFLQMALVAVVLVVGRRALERLGLSSKPATIATVVVAAALLLFGGPLIRRRRDVAVTAPVPPPIDPELIRRYARNPDSPMPSGLREASFPEEWLDHTPGPNQSDVRRSRSVTRRTTTGPDGHVDTEIHEQGPDGQIRDRAYDGPLSGAAWKALRALLRRLGNR